MPPSRSLRECAELLGVHYMTVYRYVRTGVLPAVKEGGEWRIRVADLDAFRTRDQQSVGRPRAPWDRRVHSRLLAGDEAGAWRVVESALASGLEPLDIYRKVLGPAMTSIGRGWEAGEVTVGEEHRATSAATRVVGRLSSRFRPSGRRRQRLVIGTAPGERHALAVAIASDFLRSNSFDVVDLGCDLPIESFCDIVSAVDPAGVVVSVTSTDAIESTAQLIGALRGVTARPIIVGGLAIALAGADGLAADARGATADDAIEALESLLT